MLMPKRVKRRRVQKGRIKGTQRAVPGSASVTLESKPSSKVV